MPTRPTVADATPTTTGRAMLAAAGGTTRTTAGVENGPTARARQDPQRAADCLPLPCTGLRFHSAPELGRPAVAGASRVAGAMRSMNPRAHSRMTGVVGNEGRGSHHLGDLSADLSDSAAPDRAGRRPSIRNKPSNVVYGCGGQPGMYRSTGMSEGTPA